MMFIIVKNTVLAALYEFKTDLFIEMFCENISKPDLHCDGKCMLAKMQADQNKEAAANVLKQLQTEVVFCLTTPIVCCDKSVHVINEIDQTPQIYSSLYSYLYTSSCINPPEKVLV